MSTIARNDSYNLEAGRVHHLNILSNDNLATDGIRIEIDELPEVGNVTVNPDNTLSFILSDANYRGALEFTYTITDKNGVESQAKAVLNVTPGSHASGWGQGDHYTLQKDADGWSVIEAGQNHRKIYVSPNGSDTADGLSAGTAMSVEAGMKLWSKLTANDGRGDPAPTSHWLLLEKGHSYDLPGLISNGASGESAIHPLYIGSYGSGEKPVITSDQLMKGSVENVVFEGLTFTDGYRILGAAVENGANRNILMEDVTISDEPLVIQNYIDRFTIYRSHIQDVYREAPAKGGTIFEGGNALPDREQGVYANYVDGFLIEQTIADMNGFNPGYLSDPTLQPATIYSHNFYLSFYNTDLTFRDNISARAASVGAQMRSGAFVEGNLFLDNNIGFNVIGGGAADPLTGQHAGNHSWVIDNIVTSAAVRQYVGPNGGYVWGFSVNNGDSLVVDNIVAHKFDPNNPAEIALKSLVKGALNGQPMTHNPQDNYINNTTVFNWDGFEANKKVNNNTLQNFSNGQDLNQITIQKYAELVLGKAGATIDDLMTLLRTKGRDNWDDVPGAKDIVDFFQQGFGFDITERVGATTVRFVPYENGDGVRWDNARNWSTGDIAGSVNGDNVNLAGNWVNYSGTHYIKSLDLGDNGQLRVGQGFLNVAQNLVAGDKGAQINVLESGQLWVKNATESGMLDINLTGGRFANHGLFRTDHQTSINKGELILGANQSTFHINQNDALTIIGDKGLVGFDGTTNGVALLNISANGTLGYEFDKNGITSIKEFRSGHFGFDAPVVRSQVTISGNQAKLAVDLSDLTIAAADKTYRLMDVDQLQGTFATHAITGLKSGYAVKLTYNYQDDYLDLSVLQATQEYRSGSVHVAYVNENGANNEEQVPDAEIVVPEPEPEVVVPQPQPPVNNGTQTPPPANSNNTGSTPQPLPETGGGDVVVTPPLSIDTPVTLTPLAQIDRLLIIGTDTADELRGSFINERMLGLSGNDTIIGGSGFDELRGGRGDDIVVGGKRADMIYGGADNDLIRSGQGHDLIFTGAGNDSINSGLGNDTMTGGTGTDIFHFELAVQTDTVTDFTSGEDRIQIRGLSQTDVASLLQNASLSNGSTTLQISATQQLILQGNGEAPLISDFYFAA